MAQRSIELVVGRLVTDEAFRSAFRSNAEATLAAVVAAGCELTPIEIAALCATPVDRWERMAERLDARLQKVSFAAISREEE